MILYIFYFWSYDNAQKQQQVCGKYEKLLDLSDKKLVNIKRPEYLKFCCCSLTAGLNCIFGWVDVGILMCFMQQLQSQGRLFIINSERVVMVIKLAMASDFSRMFVLSAILIYALNSCRSVSLCSFCCHMRSRYSNFSRKQPYFNSYLLMRSGEKCVQFISGIKLTLTVLRSSGLGRRREIGGCSCRVLCSSLQ